MQPCTNYRYVRDPEAPPWAPPKLLHCGRAASFIAVYPPRNPKAPTHLGRQVRVQYLCRYCVGQYRRPRYRMVFASIRRIEAGDC